MMTVPATPTTEDITALFEELKNWSRWGADDELGMLNHLTPAHRAAAAATVTEGVSVSLAQNLPVTPTPENPFPSQHHMLAAGDARGNSGIPGYEGCRDWLGTAVHGMAVTHIDALCHMFVNGTMFGGRPPSDVRSDGAISNTIMAMAEGLVGRGVVLDIARLKGVDHLEGNHHVMVADLEAAEEAEGVTVGTGDILMVATGRETWRLGNKGMLSLTEGMAGLHPECLPWLQQREIAVLGSDGISDATPGLGIANWPFPIHQVGLTGMGLHLIDNMGLDRIAKECAARKRWSFLFVTSPLRVVGGTGCPVNPVAIF